LHLLLVFIHCRKDGFVFDNKVLKTQDLVLVRRQSFLGKNIWENKIVLELLNYLCRTSERSGKHTTFLLRHVQAVPQSLEFGATRHDEARQVLTLEDFEALELLCAFCKHSSTETRGGLEKLTAFVVIDRKAVPESCDFAHQHVLAGHFPGLFVIEL